MKKEDLFISIGDADPEYLEHSEKGAARINWKRWGALAACACLVLGLGAYGASRLFHPMGSSAAGGSGHQEGSVFMSYAGPVFPLALNGESAEISAEREICFDFSHLGDVDRGSFGSARVTDSYVLTNSGDEDAVLTALYPFSGSLRELDELMPEISVGGQKTEPLRYNGAYSGGFRGAGDEWSTSLNLDQLNSWEEYKALLGSGEYMSQAMSEPDLSALDEQVTVYFVRDETFPAAADAAAPTLSLDYSMDYDKTQVLSYNFNGGSFDQEAGYQSRSFFVASPDDRLYGCLRMLIVRGEDLDGIKMQGYMDGGCDKGDELEGVTGALERSVMSLGRALELACRDYYDNCVELIYGSQPERSYGYEEFLAEFEEAFLIFGGSRERYGEDMLEWMLSDVPIYDRVLYLAFELRIPAGGSVTVSADMKKGASFDFGGSGSENQGVEGYDLVTRLGSNLRFASQTATLVDGGLVEIVRQNFGFDPARGVNTVSLDVAEEHYYIEVRSVSPGE